MTWRMTWLAMKQPQAVPPRDAKALREEQSMECQEALVPRQLFSRAQLLQVLLLSDPAYPGRWLHTFFTKHACIQQHCLYT